MAAKSNPFAKPTAPSAPQAPVQEASAPAQSSKKDTGRKKPAPQLTEDDRKFIIGNYATKRPST